MVGQRGIPTLVYGALALGLLAGPAQAAEGELMRDAMSKIGLIEPERPNINYNERAPLVMPPGLGSKGAAKAPAKRAGKGAKAEPDAGQGQPQEQFLNLPTPQTRQTADPQWPKDPEVIQRERQTVEDRKPRGFTGTQGRQSDNNMTLSPAEMEAGGRRNGPDTPGGHKSEREASWFEPLSVLMGRKSQAEAEPAIVEPSRDILTDPPTGYRKAPVKVVRQQNAPVGGSISGNEEASPGAYLREQQAR